MITDTQSLTVTVELLATQVAIGHSYQITSTAAAANFYNDALWAGFFAVLALMMVVGVVLVVAGRP